MARIEASLLELSKRHQEIYERLSEGSDTDEELDALIEELEAADDDFSQKVESYVAFDRLLDGDIKSAESIHEKFKKRVTTLKNRKKALRDRLAFGMHVADIAKIGTKFGNVSLGTSRAVDDANLDVEQLPNRFVRQERKAIKTDIKAALESGETVPGAQLVTRHHVRMP